MSSVLKDAWRNSQPIVSSCFCTAAIEAVGMHCRAPFCVLIRRAELNLFVGQLTPKQKADPSVRHALDVQRAVSMGNYHAFFRLFLDSPNMGGYIIDHFSDRERIKALMVMTKAYALHMTLAVHVN
jgi:hypothetical protein